MLKQLVYIMVLITILSSCRKEEEGYDFSVSQDLSRFQVITLPSVNMALNLLDSLESGASLRYLGEVSYVSGDSVNPSDPSTELIYRMNYYNGRIDFDGRQRAGSVYIHFFPKSHENVFSIGFDSLTTENYKSDGTIYYSEPPEGVVGGDYVFTTTEFYTIGEVGETRISSEGSVTKDQGTGDLTFLLEKTRGTASDDRSFKYLSSGNVIWGDVCQNFIEGEVLIKPRTYSWRSLKYGFGNCGGTARAENGAVIQGFPLL